MSSLKKGSMEELFMSAKKPVMKEDLKSIHSYLDEGRETEKQALLELCNKAEVRIDDFYLVEDFGITPFVYWKDGVFLGMTTLNSAYFKMHVMEDLLKSRKRLVQDAFNNNKFDMVMALTDTSGQPLVFEYLYEHIPEDQKYKLFISLYIHQEYGFSRYDKELVKEVLSAQPESVRLEAIERLKTKLGVSDNAVVRIYRGVGEASTPLHETLSWTISKDIANFFANRIGLNGYVIEGEVKLSDVTDYLTGRNEEELLVLPEKVTILRNEKPLEQVDTGDEMALLEEVGIINEFQTIRDSLMPEKAFKSPYGYHGIQHTKRVLLHCLSLSNAMGLSDNERGILSLSALYHDIGRKHDESCLHHGEWSVEKRKELDLPLTYVICNDWGEKEIVKLTKQEQEVMEFLMKYHCKPDSEGEKALEELEPGYVKECAKELFPVFKDADGLDRVRLGDLNPGFLRTDEGKRRLQFAKDVFAFLQ